MLKMIPVPIPNTWLFWLLLLASFFFGIPASDAAFLQNMPSGAKNYFLTDLSPDQSPRPEDSCRVPRQNPRDSSSVLTVFIQEDPRRDGYHWYGYVGGDPVNYVDPAGFEQFFHQDLGSLFNAHNVPVTKNPAGVPDVPDFSGLDQNQRQAFVQDLANLIHQRAGLEDVGVDVPMAVGGVTGIFAGFAANNAAITGFTRGLGTGGALGAGIGLTAGFVYHQAMDRRCGRVYERTRDEWWNLVGQKDKNDKPYNLGELQFNAGYHPNILGLIYDFFTPTSWEPGAWGHHQYPKFGIQGQWYKFDPWYTGNKTVTPEQ